MVACRAAARVLWLCLCCRALFCVECKSAKNHTHAQAPRTPTHHTGAVTDNGEQPGPCQGA